MRSRTTTQPNRPTTRVTLKPLARNARYPGFERFSAATRLTVRITASASPENRLPRLAPSPVSRPSPVAQRRSISAQSAGDEHDITFPDSFSTHRNAGMSSFEPSRIPAWLAPVCELRSVSHSASRCVSLVRHRCISGTTPSRIARASTGNASPSISRNTIPGSEVRTWPPCRRATRLITRSMYVSSSLTPRITSITTLAAAITSAAASAQPNESTWIELLSTFDAISSTTASSTSTSTKLSASVNGSRNAAITGASTALRIAMIAAAINASPTPLTAT